VPAGERNWCKIAGMCSNFGLNLHPDRTPAAVESHWYSTVVRLFAYLRRKFHGLAAV
jgi:hypothetical protein